MKKFMKMYRDLAHSYETYTFQSNTDHVAPISPI